MAKQDDRVKIRELPPEDGDKNITSADWLAIGKKATEITVKASVGEVIGSGISAGSGIQVDNVDNDSFTGVRITNTYSAPEVDLSDIQDDINTNKTDIANLQNNKVAAFAHVDPKPPSPPSKGDLWWDTNTAKMYVYTGDAWVVTTPGASGKNYDDDIKSLDERIRRLPTTGGDTGSGGGSGNIVARAIYLAHGFGSAHYWSPGVRVAESKVELNQGFSDIERIKFTQLPAVEHTAVQVKYTFQTPRATNLYTVHVEGEAAYAPTGGTHMNFFESVVFDKSETGFSVFQKRITTTGSDHPPVKQHVTVID